MNNKRNITLTPPVVFTEGVWQYSCPFEWINSITLKENILRKRYNCTVYTYTLTTTVADVNCDIYPYKIIFKVFKPE